MKKIIVFLLMVIPMAAFSQVVQTAAVGKKVRNVQVRDSNNEPVWLPEFGKKHLLIFYPDPDHYKQNKEFTDYLEDNHIISDKIHGFGIVNLKDAPLFPNGLVRTLIRQKEKKNNVTIYTDPDYLFRDAWGLGDCNNLFAILFVTKEGEIAFFHKGVVGDKEKAEFFRVIDIYK